ncbi:hypothetical protein [Paenibacillus thalictri]|uniref:Copper amine oxidase-like N-terminal domain-containing protein n=1 Tax=Paenibacillus thalictri TaxID=2527873 RepID=A0A4Q9DNH0_9BACL|nr:hypothetical protein [Paenibacillus thalictri]TBL77455.1 hypothetical protein EYB31_18480 [Paenibacillus thalictri]
MMKRIRRVQWIASAVLLLASSVLPAAASAEPKQVQAEIPEFPVKVNGTPVDSLHSMYPLLLYKDITYFPLTWDMAQALQWQVEWNAEDGLKVYPANVTRGGAAYGYVKMPLQQDLNVVNRYSILYRAFLPEFPVEINNESIDNVNETYPVITFRDVTYFPLTWRFAHDMLNIDLQWDEKEGFDIRSPQQPVLERILFDDTHNLYFYPTLVTKPGYSLLKVNKSLAEKPVWVTEAEAKTENPSIDLTTYYKPAGTDVSDSIKTDGDYVYYKDIKLDLEADKDPQGQKKDVVFEAQWFALGEGEGLLSVATSGKILGVSVRRMPYQAELFHVKGNTATKLQGFRDIPQGVIASPDGSCWIYANIDRRGDIRDNYYRYAQLALLEPDGKFHVINDQLSADLINVLGTDNMAVNQPSRADGSITFEAFEKNPQLGLYGKPGGKIYTIDTKRNVQLLQSYDSGIPFMDRNQNIFIYEPKNNTITSLSAKQTKFWWDYELIGP